METPAKKKSVLLSCLLMLTMFGPTAFGKSSVIVSQVAALKSKIVVIKGMNDGLYVAAKNCARYPDKMKAQICDPAQQFLDQTMAIVTSLQSIGQASGCDALKMKAIVAKNIQAIDSITGNLNNQSSSFAESHFPFGQVEKNILEGLEWDKRYPQCGQPTISGNIHSNNETLNFVVWKKSLFCKGLLDSSVLGELASKPTSDCLIEWLKTLKASLLKSAGPSDLAPSCHG